MSKNGAKLSLGLSVLLALTACVGKPEPLPQAPLGAVSGTRFTLDLLPGPHYQKRQRAFVFSYTVQPQVAVWLEDEAGTFIATLYATEAVVTGRFRAAPRQGRPEALPVWTHLKQGAVDAVSAPTMVGTELNYGSDLAARLPVGTYVVKLETNRSYDWNDRYTEQNSGVNGQPSLVYAARIRVGTDRDEAEFEPLGTGSVDGSDGILRPGLAGIDTALELFSSMKVSFEP